MVLAAILILGNGCGTRRGGFVSRDDHVFLIKNNLDKFRVNRDSTVGKKIGILTGKLGNEISPLGFYEDKQGYLHSYLVYNKPDSFYINDAVLYDDYVYSYRVGSSFSVLQSEDPTMWGRAVEYVSKRSGRPVKIASDNLIESERSSDSTSTGYIVSKIVDRDHVTYEVSALSNSKSFNERSAVRRLGFYMVTGYYYR